MFKVEVVDWSDDAYRECGREKVIETFYTETAPGFSYDGGRLEIDGWPDTIYLSSHQFSVRVAEE